MVSNRLGRTARGVLAVACTAIAVSTVPGTAAAASSSAASGSAVGVPASPPGLPGSPRTPDIPPEIAETVEQVRELSRRGAVLTEEWHLATDRLHAAQQDADQARERAAAATAVAERARAAQEDFRAEVDRLTLVTFQGARISSVTALLMSQSPEQFLDQMYALDILAVSSQEAMSRLEAAVARAEEAETAATDAETDAAVAELDASRIAGDVAQAWDEMNRQISVVQARLAELTVDELSYYATEGLIDFPLEVAGEGVGAMALRAALTRQGAPYVWGAVGPETFDCSGLVQWAYRQVGVNLPRSSWQQSRVGTPVVTGLRPGDLVALYEPVSHIGLYVGDGLYLNAPQAGDVVKVAPVPWHAVTAVRRVE